MLFLLRRQTGGYRQWRHTSHSRSHKHTRTSCKCAQINMPTHAFICSLHQLWIAAAYFLISLFVWIFRNNVGVCSPSYTHKKKTGLGWQRDMRWEHKLLFLTSRRCEAVTEANVCISHCKLPQLAEERGSCDDMLCYEREFTPQIDKYCLRCLPAWGDVEFQLDILQQKRQKEITHQAFCDMFSSLFVNGFNLERERK